MKTLHFLIIMGGFLLISTQDMIIALGCFIIAGGLWSARKD